MYVTDVQRNSALNYFCCLSILLKSIKNDSSLTISSCHHQEGTQSWNFLHLSEGHFGILVY